MIKFPKWVYVVFVLLAVWGVPGLATKINDAQIEREKWECLNWVKQNEELVGFYLLDWQRNQCSALNIDVSEIKTPEEANRINEVRD